MPRFFGPKSISAGVLFEYIYQVRTNGLDRSGLFDYPFKAQKLISAHVNESTMKIFKLTFMFAFLSFAASGQSVSIVGDWQLVKASSCLEETASREADDQILREEMHSRTSPTPQVVSFKENATGEESSRILNSSKTANLKKFFYKFNGEMLLILDKRSQTISDSYMVDKFTSDSLIVSSASRPCETRIFVKINPEPSN